MCGLFGFSGSPNTLNPIILKSLALVSQNRGTHSTGWATDSMLDKFAGSARFFITIADMPPMDSTEIIGHTRYATKGAKTDENAHPFKFEGLVGAHNGTISNYLKLKSQYSISDKVDSQVALRLIEMKGLDDAIREFEGTYAFSFIDENGLNLYRWDKPLWVGERDGALYYASLEEYLTPWGIENIRQLDENTHYIISEGEIEERKLDFTPKRERKTVGYQYSNSRYSGNPYHTPKTRSSYTNDECMLTYQGSQYSVEKGDIEEQGYIFLYKSRSYDWYGKRNGDTIKLLRSYRYGDENKGKALGISYNFKVANEYAKFISAYSDEFVDIVNDKLESKPKFDLR